MPEVREIYDPFIRQRVTILDELILRLRGKYPVGPTMPSGEPEFGWQIFPTTPIMLQAADRIEELEAQLKAALAKERP